MTLVRNMEIAVRSLTRTSMRPTIGCRAWRVSLLAIAGALTISLSACGGARAGMSIAPFRSGKIAIPTFSLTSGTYTSPQGVAIISATRGADIYFTTDGSDPSPSSRIYGGPISVTAPITLKAVVVARDGAESDVASSSYVIDAAEQSFSDLPVPRGFRQPVRHGGAGRVLTVLPWAGFMGAVTYTFDDGWGTQIADYPLLEATGTRMTFYLICGGDLDPATWARAVKDGNELGNHTEHHCLSNGTCPAGGTWSGSVEAEYDECTDYIKKKYGLAEVWTTAAPYGDPGYERAARTRFLLNRGTIPGQIAGGDHSDPFYLRAYVARAGDGADTFNKLIDLARENRRWQILVFHSLDYGYDWVKVDDLIASIDHAKQQRDIWIDSMVNVGAYWIGERAITEAKVKERGGRIVLHWTLPNHFPTGRFVRATLSQGTLKQEGRLIPRDKAGYYEIALDPGSLTISN